MKFRDSFGGYIIVLNGPPGSGKDSLGEYIKKTTDVALSTFKFHLVEIARSIANVSFHNWECWYNEDKEAPRSELWGNSCRSFLILVSETMIKPNTSKNYFGRLAADNLRCRMESLKISGVCFTDSGFMDELKEVIDVVGPKKVVVVQLHREGKNFEGDSRQYLDRQQFPSVTFIQQQNDRPLNIVGAELLNTLLCVVADKRKEDKSKSTYS